MSLIISEKGSSTANSYISLEEADLYFSTRLNSSEWESADTTNREKALIMATRILDTLSFSGRKWKDGSPEDKDYQALQWPRFPEYNDPYMLGIPHLMTSPSPEREWVNLHNEPIMPTALKNATCEQAYFLLRTIQGLDKREHLKGQGLKSISYPDINETFESSFPIAPAAYRFLSKLNCLQSSLRIVRG